ncbi:MAG TPA: SAM-dependent methyltransferase, partial [Pyrinomonadaceae bacterium]|nr:SAM-dependent methyltransferase [Pyrinomonadaceae bacterium]
MTEAVESVSGLTERIRERIRREGPITFCDWMRMALYDEHEGYYCRTDRPKWGRAGDYRTSPERSSLFAATFTRYFARFYEELGRPREWTIAELGAGDGSFAFVVLETLQRSFPSVYAATRYVIDEPGPNSRSIARERLLPFTDRVEFKTLDSIAVDPGIVFSNELLDAFPVHRVVRRQGRLQEFYVTLGRDDDFQWTVGEVSTPTLADYFSQGQTRLTESRVAEVNLEIEDWFRQVSGQLRAGYLVTVDYGATAEELYGSADREQGTLRGFYQHRLVDNVLERPGEQDITTTVDWSFVQRLGKVMGFEVCE